MGTPLEQNSIHGDLATVASDASIPELLGYGKLLEISFADRTIPVALINYTKDIYVGQIATLKPTSTDVIADHISFDDSATVIGFAMDGLNIDHRVIRVVQIRRGNVGGFVTVSPDNIKHIFSPLKIISKPEVGQVTMKNIPVDLLFAPSLVHSSKNQNRIHVMAVHGHWNDKENTMAIGDNVIIPPQEDGVTRGVVTGFIAEVAPHEQVSVDAYVRIEAKRGTLIRWVDIYQIEHSEPVQ